MVIKSLVGLAARRLARDPRFRAKAQEMVKTHAVPVAERKAKAVKQVVRNAEPGTHPARVAGRAVRRLLDG